MPKATAKRPVKVAPKPAPKSAKPPAQAAPKTAPKPPTKTAARTAPASPAPKPAVAKTAVATPPKPVPEQPAPAAPPPAAASDAAPVAIRADAKAAPPAPAPKKPTAAKPTPAAETQPAAAAPPPEFEVGDHVVYPTHGVGRVTGIVTEEIAGHKLTLIVVEFEENRMVLRVPVAKARTAGLRKLSSRKAIEMALSTLKGRARVKRTMWSRRAQEYEAKINSGDPVAIAEVVRDLHRNAGQPDQSFSERQIYEQAMDRLAAELAAIEQVDKPTAAAKLATMLKAA
ncbi:CarD family transcriptional regulator [Elioraea sp.]|uniref:CarD family transcriptional regulator n=1 Tax=Elioraea sp. TaxID=2185103 RepID=UPI00307D9C8D